MVLGPTKWGACARTVSYSDTVFTLACWNSIIATGSGKDIIILDALTGSQTAILSGHTRSVWSLTFSLDGTLLVSGSSDGTIKLWDVQTGAVVKTFCGHTDRVTSVSISSDNAMIASGSKDKAVCLWNIETGDCLVVGRHDGDVNSVRFSPTNSQLLLSSSYGTVQQWSIDGHQTGSLIPGFNATFSPDGTQFISCSGMAVTVRNTDSEMIMAEFNSVKRADCCCFSPNGRVIAVAAEHTIYLWDITGPNPCLIQTLIGHTHDITSLVFPSSLTLISASWDKSVKFWQIGASSADPVGPDSESPPLTSASIQAVSLQSKDGLAFSIDSEGVVKIWDIFTGLCKESIVTPARNIPAGDMQVIGGRLAIAWYKQNWYKSTVYFWDAQSSKLQIVGTTSYQPHGLRMSGDGLRVCCVDAWKIHFWTIGTMMHVSKKHSGGSYYLDPLRMDDSKVLICSESSTVVWDFGTPGSTPFQSFEPPSDRPHLNLINWKQLDTSLVRIQDRVTGKDIFQLCGRYAKPSAMQWDGQYLIAGNKSGEVFILDFN